MPEPALNSDPTTSPGNRLDWIDGLRGTAVLMVIVSHAWNFAGYAPFVRQNAGTIWVLPASLGPWGVSLFLVLSGFCLSYAPLQRRVAGQTDWFSWRHFVRQRCRRILPAYYAARLLFSALAWYFKRQGTDLPIMRAPSPTDFLAHLLLLHNNLPAFAETINSPLWSLGLEWQWYGLFPLLLLAGLRFPRRTIGLCLAVALLWATLSGHLPALSTEHTLPGRLLEFTFGILAARLVVAGRRIPASWLTLLLVAGLGATLLLPALLLTTGLYFPLSGLAFAALILLAARGNRACAWTRRRPLTRIGVISYSLYLVHWPLLGAVEAVLHFGLHAPTLLTITAGILSVLPFGWSFHILFERPWLRRPQRPPLRRTRLTAPPPALVSAIQSRFPSSKHPA